MSGLRISPSAYKTFADCPTKWWLQKVCGLKEAPKDHLILGTTIHALVENWALNGIEPSVLSVHDVLPNVQNVDAYSKGHKALGEDAVKAARAGWPMVEDLYDRAQAGEVTIEACVRGRCGPLPYIGYVDVSWVRANELGAVLYGIDDHKSSSSPMGRYTHTADTIGSDPQLLFYAKAMWPDYDGPVHIAHNYFPTKGNQFRRQEGFVLRPAIERNWASFEETAQRMVDLRDKAPEISFADHVDVNPSACDKYGGCPFKASCRVHNNPNFVRPKSLFTYPEPEGPRMSALEALRARKAQAAAAAAATAAATPATEPEPEPSVDHAAVITHQLQSLTFAGMETWLGAVEKVVEAYTDEHEMSDEEADAFDAAVSAVVDAQTAAVEALKAAAKPAGAGINPPDVEEYVPNAKIGAAIQAMKANAKLGALALNKFDEVERAEALAGYELKYGAAFGYTAPEPVAEAKPEVVVVAQPDGDDPFAKLGTVDREPAAAMLAIVQGQTYTMGDDALLEAYKTAKNLTRTSKPGTRNLITAMAGVGLAVVSGDSVTFVSTDACAAEAEEGEAPAPVAEAKPAVAAAGQAAKPAAAPAQAPVGNFTLIGYGCAPAASVPFEAWLAASGVNAEYDKLVAGTAGSKEPLVDPPELSPYGKGVVAMAELCLDAAAAGKLPAVLYIPTSHPVGTRFVDKLEGRLTNTIIFRSRA